MDTEIKSKRGGWGSNFGFLMASIGSAVGLGNIWGFPYKMGKSGGAVFLLLYLVLVVLVGVTVMLGELALGRRSGKSAVSTYRGLSKKYTWLGYAGIVCGFCIMCFYFVLGGIVLRYAVGYFLAIFGGSEFAWSGQGTGFFGYFCLLVFIILYIACQPGAAEGYKFMFSPDFSVFSNPEIGFGRVLKNAAGQMFFSLSIGLGVMMTYGSYLGKQEHLQARTRSSRSWPAWPSCPPAPPSAWSTAPAPDCCSPRCRRCSPTWAASAISSASSSTCSC